ncbi:MAG: 3-hydroxyacyl-CoA dehydrogenase [Alphaproteobacteria bacterium]
MAQKIALIGSGFIGRSWAIAFSRAGYDIALYDPANGAVDAALRFIDEVLDDLDKNDLLNGESPSKIRGRIKQANDIRSALDGAIHVQENAPENLEMKRKVFAELDASAGPDTVLSSSASAILPSLFTEKLAGRHRCIVAHPVNPPYLIPVVELIPAPWTSPETVDRVEKLMIEAGQAPIKMKREIEGFIVNRLQCALLEEAFRLVGEGYASTKAVDYAVCHGLGLRWSFMGPFETIDLNSPGGVGEYIERYEGLFRSLWESQQHIVPWSGKLAEQVLAERDSELPRTRLLERQMWRDRRLMALAAHKRAAGKQIGD